jgi:solute carrier family 25 protein 38
VVRLSFGAGLHFLFLDSIRSMLEKQRPDGKLSRADTFFMGGLARAGSAVIMCPITVIKTRMEYGGSGGIQYRVR